ncbi:MAG: hypothetical protein QF921_08240 [Pseudomonadales bacterium]|jgi:acyl-CoA thioesterase FadM|nr:hypothetical protein [Pseudomonadales bacterium]MDP6472473.1 hypothetical protein [Pseudomonadales bacterium]MDP6828716.1 hypothetical protein [Pseudomonadales bacterium]MDP6971487.1 hypothetical protein [Pseudomonadales bacterium]|tara:strand:+ start:1881 stop:2822 length:942 start_codon:yes stop_codon:yes gene_type:complete
MRDTSLIFQGLTDLHTSRVEESEIDELGHLSVPFYEERALRASRILAEVHGLSADDCQDEGVELTVVDGFMRNYREQFLNAPLLVRAGVLAANSERLRFYQELFNQERDELSATFVYELQLQTRATRTPVAVPADVVESAAGARVEWPAHGRTRSLDLTRAPFMLQLTEARQHNLMFNQPRTIMQDECDPAGIYLAHRFQHLPYSGSLVDDSSSEWVFETEDGHRLGIADLETRNVLLQLPRVGDRVQTCHAEVDIGSKTFCRNHWVFGIDSGTLLSTATTVSVTLDLDARRAVEIPATMRAAMEPQHHPELR